MIAALCVLLLMAAKVQAVEKKKLNFILIMTDDQGFDDYGFRQPPLQTPNLDRLMKQGVQFTRFYTAPSCGPTRAALLTGRNFMRTGTSSVGYGGDPPHPDEYMLGEAFQDAGYVTGMTGKWNLGTADAERPNVRGFNETYEIAADFDRSKGRYDHVNAPVSPNGTYAGLAPGWQVERVTDAAVDFITRHKADPFFIYVPYSQPHEPWLCRKTLQKKYIEQGISESYAMLLGMLEQLDSQVGRIMRTLERNGLSDNTVIAFFGDNGPTPKTRLVEKRPNGFYTTLNTIYNLNKTEWAARNPSGFRSKKATGWENGIRNRLGIYCPARFKAKEVSDMALVMDIYPTFLQLAGHKRKKDAPSLDGRSLRRFLRKEKASWPDERDFFTAQPGAIGSFRGPDGWDYRFTKNYSLPLDKRDSVYIQGEWVLVNEKGSYYLFNLATDPQQKKDLKKSSPEKYLEMRKRYFEKVDYVRKDPHAWNVPVQTIGFPGVEEPYVETEYTHRVRGDNGVFFSYSYFREIGAIQEIRVEVLRPATYRIFLIASSVPSGTKVRFYAGKSRVASTLTVDERIHELGEISFKKGIQNIGLELLDCDQLDILPNMKMWNIQMKPV